MPPQPTLFSPPSLLLPSILDFYLEKKKDKLRRSWEWKRKRKKNWLLLSISFMLLYLSGRITSCRKEKNKVTKVLRSYKEKVRERRRKGREVRPDPFPYGWLAFVISLTFCSLLSLFRPTPTLEHLHSSQGCHLSASPMQPPQKQENGHWCWVWAGSENNSHHKSGVRLIYRS